MKKSLFIILLAFAANPVNAQSKDRQVLASSGTYITTPTAQLSFTVGETAIQYLSASTASISQGFQQANNEGTSVAAIHPVDAQVWIYPNPFINFIEIKSDKALSHPLFQLIDANGKLVRTTIIETQKNTQWHIELNEIASGNYWLTINADGKQSTYPLTHTGL